MASLSSNPKLGNTGVSSLVKSAQSLQNQIATYQDAVMKSNFNTDPSSQNLSQYIKYLNGRISNLHAAGTISSATKALSLSNDVKSATVTSTTFNIDMIAGQMLSTGATDQAKLDYLTQNVLSNPLIQQSPDLYVKYMNQAYGLQQSVQYQQQVQQTAATAQASSDLAAQERGFRSGEDALNAQWKQLTNAYKNGDNKAVQQAFKDATAVLAPIYKASGITIPKNFNGDLATAKVGHLLGLASYYEHAAVAAGPDNPDYHSYYNKAVGVVQGTELRQALTDAMAPSNLYSAKTTYPNGTPETNQVMNAISGFQRMQVQVPGLQPIVLNVPTTTGNSQTPYAALGKGKQGSLDGTLNKLGFNIESTKGGQLEVSVSNKALHWLGHSGLQAGDRLTLIPTSRGFQFVDKNNSLFGVSFDNKGLPGLYQAGLNNAWKLVGGQYGFNPHMATGLPVMHPAPAPLAATMPKFVSHFVGSQIQNRGPQMVQRAGGGYNFTNAQGKPISAAMYSQLTKTPFRNLLQGMANHGDTGAKSALNFVGNDYGYNPNAIKGNGNLYNSLTYGTGHQFTGASAPNISGGQLQLPSGLRL